MAQCFVSTYRNHYRWHDPEATPSCKPVDGFVKAIPNEDFWISTAVADDEQDTEDVNKRLYRRLLKRMITTYGISYCKNMFSKILHDATTSSFESQLLEYCKNLYEPDSLPKISPPLAGTRKMFGYIRPTRNYTPMTHYQFVIGQTGYRILKGEKKAVKTEENKKDTPEKKKVKTVPKCDCFCCRKTSE